MQIHLISCLHLICCLHTTLHPCRCQRSDAYDWDSEVFRRPRRALLAPRQCCDGRFPRVTSNSDGNVLMHYIKCKGHMHAHRLSLRKGISSENLWGSDKIILSGGQTRGPARGTLVGQESCDFAIAILRLRPEIAAIGPKIKNCDLKLLSVNFDHLDPSAMAQMTFSRCNLWSIRDVIWNRSGATRNFDD